MSGTLTDARLGARPARGLVDHVNAVELTDELANAEDYVQIDLAHALMLTRQGVFDAQQGSTLAQALLDLLEDRPQQVLAGDPEIGTITLQLERYLEDRCGPAGHDIQRARSRIDQKATGVRMALRTGLLRTMAATLELGSTLLEASAEHDDVTAPGYTHLQHAQPTTLGHYFNAHYWAASRNLERMTQLYERLNACPLGSAAYSGTSWPVDRDLTAAYLGFARPIPNARDAGMAATDAGAELASTLGLLLSAISRCASDLYFWSSSEVGLVRLDPSLCGTSSMMPQKRNPIVLERIRALAGDAAGWGASQLGLMHLATSTDADLGYVHNRLPTYCTETAGAVALLAEAVASLEVETEALHRSSASNWTTASALADHLVRHHGLPFRSAHHLVARFVAAHEAAGIDAATPRPDLAEPPLDDYTSEQLARLLDVRTFIETRTSAGGASRQRREELTAEAAADHARHATTVEALIEAVTTARGRLIEDARSLVAGSWPAQ